MYIDFDGRHSGGSSFDMYMIFGFCYKMWAITTGISSTLKKKKKSQYMVSQPELSSDPLIGSDQGSGHDKLVSEPRFRNFWKSLRLRMYLHSNVLA